MYKYDLVEKRIQGKGKTDHWKLNFKNVTPNLVCKIKIEDIIQKLNFISSQSKIENSPIKDIPYYISRNNIDIYGLFPLCSIVNKNNQIEKEDIPTLKEFEKILKKFNNAKIELFKLNIKCFAESFSIIVEDAYNLCNSWIDKYIVSSYAFSVAFHFLQNFDITEKGSVDWPLFEKDIFPYIIKIDNTKIFFQIMKSIKKSTYFKKEFGENTNFSNNEILKKIDGYKLSRKLSERLFQLFYLRWLFVLYMPYFTVVCDYGPKDAVMEKEFKFEATLFESYKKNIKNKF
jgi:hypothetical protein